MENSERLIVAADFDPRQCGGRPGVRSAVATLARDLRGLGVVLKVNSALRDRGYGFIADLRAFGIGVFADLKLCDIPATMAFDAALLLENPPDILTVMCSAGVEGMRAVKGVLGERTMVLGVTVLTSLGYGELQALGFMPSDILRDGRATIEARRMEQLVVSYAKLAQRAGLDGVIASPQEAAAIQQACGKGFQIVTPGIRPDWAQVPGDDQKRTATPAEAIKAGARRIVIGRPITQAAPNDKDLPQSPREAVELTLTEIAAAVAA
ncbi:MAG: orotidine-5'-phosphate decarboxylase [Candidatus Uhrbacteria bacterium]|nr:orotidine-5'-phosphate decarboxylase [Candidatus Uhrbacteria bacterium]